MDERMRITPKAGRVNRYRPEALRRQQKFYIGIDIGSTSSDVAILDEAGKIVFGSYQRIKGKPIETVRMQLDEVFGRINPSDVVLTVATGSAGRFLAKLLDIPFVNEVPAQAAAVCHLYTQYKQATIIEMGGQDSKLIFLSMEEGQGRVRDFTLNTVCAAGTGSFLDQQAQRLGINIEDEFGRMAVESKNVPRMAGRCSVFAKSDMIHLQQQATPTCDIIAGLCLALARNLKSDLGCGRKFVKPIIFTGGVAANIGVVQALEKVFGLAEGGLVVPEHHFFTGAIGAILIAKSRATAGSDGEIHIEKIDGYLAQRGCALEDASRMERLTKPVLAAPESPVYDDLLCDVTEPIDAYLGVDVGSLSTNVVVIDKEKRVLAKSYLMTAGRPLDAIRRGLDIVGKKVAGKVKILGASATGSGRYLTGDFIGADVVINEITAQAAGAVIVNPKVDTIFEIGGQDSKYISLENGVIVDFTMNHACAAGTGSFLEEQAQRLNININREFAELAFASEAPIKLGERCTVFMESDLLRYQQQGARRSELVAGLSYSIVLNYLNRVVGRRKIGSNICFQGGTAFNKAVWAAFEKVTGKPIMVPDHHEVTGALGAASIAAERMRIKAVKDGREPESNFRGFDNLVRSEYKVESFVCEHCPNNCEIKKVRIPGAEPLYYGSKCDRYNLKKKDKTIKDLGAFEYRRRKLLEFSGLAEGAHRRDGESGLKHEISRKETIGLPMALIYWELLPLFSRFFRSLGFEVVSSGITNKKIIRMGVESVTAQPCYPVKIAHGHIAELIQRGVDYVFIPSIVSMTANYPENEHNQLCPYVQSLAYQAQTAFADELGRTEILTVPIRLGEGKKLLRKSFAALGKKLGIGSSEISRAIREGFSAQKRFERVLKEKGKQILNQVGPGKKLFVLISRPYNGCDEGINMQLPRKLAELGAEVIPMDMLSFDEALLSDKFLHKSVYWTYGQKILRAAELIKNDPGLFAIYLSNFSCGPDSFLQTFFRDIMAQKPYLQLEIDEHSADAGVITRLEAFLESLKHYNAETKRKAKTRLSDTKFGIRDTEKKTKSPGLKRKLYIPYMGDCSYGIAASFRAYGQPAEVMPLADEAALLEARKFTTGKECLPFAMTTGEMLKTAQSDDFDADKAAFFMPSGSGPCRFGMYNCMHRLILRYAGVKGASVISPNQDCNFYKELTKNVNGSVSAGFVNYVWVCAIAIDLLYKLILRLRPFARDTSRIQQVYDSSLRLWIEAAEKHRSLSELVEVMDSIAEEFARVQLDHKIKKPRIGIVGEIYVRSHPFANMNIIRRLEQLGAVCDLASFSEWIYYTNFLRKNTARRRRRLRGFFTGLAQNYIQHKIESKLAEPLEKRFGKLAEGPIENVIEAGLPYLHHSFEGEAILSVGKIIEYHHHGAGGVVNVMPFSCMPSTIVSAQTMHISAQCNGMPILNLSFDGQEDSTLSTRLEAFVEQVRQREKLNLSVSQLITT